MNHTTAKANREMEEYAVLARGSRGFLGSFAFSWEQRKLGEMTAYRNGRGHEDKQSDSGTYELINLNSVLIDGGLKPSGRFIDESNETLLRNDLVMVLSDVGHGDLLGRVAIIDSVQIVGVN